MSRDDHRLERRRVGGAFDAAAADYERFAVLQAQVREQLLERLELVDLAPATVLDVGAGTGAAVAALRRRYRRATVVAVDLAPAMLRQVRRLRRFGRHPAVCADAQHLPFADASVDVVFSSLMLQWCNEPEAFFAECRRVLRPRGLLSFSTFGPDTLRELRAAWAAVDDRTHVNRFVDMHDLGDALVRAGLAEPVLDVDRYTLTYEDVTALMRDLRGVGSRNLTAGRSRGLTGRGRMARLAEAYEGQRRDGRLPATYEVVYGQAWAPPPGAGAPLVGGEARISPSRIGRRRE